MLACSRGTKYPYSSFRMHSKFSAFGSVQRPGVATPLSVSCPYVLAYRRRMRAPFIRLSFLALITLNREGKSRPKLRGLVPFSPDLRACSSRGKRLPYYVAAPCHHDLG